MFQSFEPSRAGGDHGERLGRLRAFLARRRLAALLVPRADVHQGEFVAPAAERLVWLTGFSGSAGLAVVAAKRAALFVDGRYVEQARGQIDRAAYEVLNVADTTPAAWLAAALRKGSIIGFDPWLHTARTVEELASGLAPKGLRLRALAQNPIDALWGSARPPPSLAPALPHPERYAGKSAADKLAELRAALRAEGQDAAVLTLPDSICWLFNIRGSDLAHTPVALAFALVPAKGKAELFIDARKIPRETATHLAPLAKILPPDALGPRLAALKASARSIRLDPASAAEWFLRRLGHARIAKAADPCLLPKARKNAVEIAGARAAHRRDGAAVVRFLAWLDRASAGGTVDEITAVRQLEDFRRASQALKEVAFDTIAGSGPNGAIVHYRVTTASNRTLKAGELFLVDSGAQYLDGTTDITRTVAIGAPTVQMQQRFTAVLKGHIALAAARFPTGSRGVDLEPLARAPLWASGLDFDHGTGHGVGSYLAVHEGPQSISKRGLVPLEPGMIVSDEPGYYKVGAYGIRIENLLLVSEAEAVEGGERAMLGFETLTLAPIDRRLILPAALTPSERAWLNAYHGRVRERLHGDLAGEDRAWLEAATAPL